MEDRSPREGSCPDGRVDDDGIAFDRIARARFLMRAAGHGVEQACAAAGPFGAAVLGGLDPLEAQRRLG